MNLDNDEPLLDDLVPHLHEGPLGQMLHHPLVIAAMYVPQFNHLYNAEYRRKLAALGEAERNGNWETYVWLHERPYRVDAFCEVMDRMDNVTYWSLLREIWTDSENIRENAEVWETLLQNDRAGRHYFVGDEDAFDGLPESFVIYQGHTLDRDDGWSWTTVESTAVWFARRFGMLEDATPIVSVGTVKKADVLAYITSRSEHEIIVNPELVNITRVYAPGEAS